jgi:hypothetical protein
VMLLIVYNLSRPQHDMPGMIVNVASRAKKLSMEASGWGDFVIPGHVQESIQLSRVSR